MLMMQTVKPADSFRGVVEFLATEMFNPNSSINVRKIVQSCLALLASRTGSEVSELLEPLYQPLLQPLIVRPLRAKTVDQQASYVACGCVYSSLFFFY